MEDLKETFKNDQTYKDLIKDIKCLDYDDGKWFGTCNNCPATYTKHFKDNCDSHHRYSHELSGYEV